MARYAINQEGVNALKELANTLLMIANEIMEAGSVCERTVRSIGDSLGLYEDSILDIIAANRQILNNNKDDIISLAVMIAHKADEVSEMVQMLLGDTAGGSLGGSSSGSLGKNSGKGSGSSEKLVQTSLDALAAYMCAHNYGKDDFGIYSKDSEWQRLHRAAFPEYYRKKEEQESLRQNSIRETLYNRGKNAAFFSGHVVTEAPNGSWFVVGNDANVHERFLQFWNESSRNYLEEKCDEIRYIDSRKVEGISISARDLENPQYFWGMHGNGNSLEAWESRSQNLNFIEAELAQGKSYEELLARPELRECLETYFNKNHPKPITVMEVEGEDFYEFSGDGRHRLLTAQKMGATILMKIVGKRKKIIT